MCIPICLACDDMACCLCGSLTACCCCGGGNDRRDDYNRRPPRSSASCTCSQWSCSKDPRVAMDTTVATEPRSTN